MSWSASRSVVVLSAARTCPSFFFAHRTTQSPEKRKTIPNMLHQTSNKHHEINVYFYNTVGSRSEVRLNSTNASHISMDESIGSSNIIYLPGCMTRPRKSAEKIAEPTVYVGLNMETITGPFFSSAHVWNMMHAELTSPPCNNATTHLIKRGRKQCAPRKRKRYFSRWHYHEHEGEDDLKADLRRAGAEPPRRDHLERCR
jgi:hypothetical protein